MSWCERNSYLTFQFPKNANNNYAACLLHKGSEEDLTSISLTYQQNPYQGGYYLKRPPKWQVLSNDTDNEWCYDEDSQLYFRNIVFETDPDAMSPKLYSYMIKDIEGMSIGYDVNNDTHWTTILPASSCRIYGSLRKSLSENLKRSNDPYKLSWMFYYDKSIMSSWYDDENGISIDTTSFVLNDGSINVTDHCFIGMFYGQRQMTDAYIRSTTDINNTCFDEMFYDCTSLKSIHYPKSFENDKIFNSITNAPQFGAPSSCNIMYDL